MGFDLDDNAKYLGQDGWNVYDSLVFSILFWFRPHWIQTDNDYHSIVRGNANGSDDYWGFWKWNDNQLYVGSVIGGSTDYRIILTSAEYTLNQESYNLLGLTFGSSTLRAYLNGSQIGIRNGVSMAGDSYYFRIGNDFPPGATANGVFGPLANWRRVLTGDEVMAAWRGIEFNEMGKDLYSYYELSGRFSGTEPATIGPPQPGLIITGSPAAAPGPPIGIYDLDFYANFGGGAVLEAGGAGWWPLIRQPYIIGGGIH